MISIPILSASSLKKTPAFLIKRIANELRSRRSDLPLEKLIVGVVLQQLSKCHNLVMGNDASSSSHCTKTKPLLGGNECCLYALVVRTCQLPGNAGLMEHCHDNCIYLHRVDAQEQNNKVNLNRFIRNDLGHSFAPLLGVVVSRCCLKSSLSLWVFLSGAPTSVAPSQLIRKRGRLEYPPPAALVSSLLTLRTNSACDWPRFYVLQQEGQRSTVADLERFDVIQVSFVETSLPSSLGRNRP